VSLAAQNRRYFIGQTVIGASIVNAVINGAFGWLAMLELPTISLWGVPGIAIDTVLTAFGVAFGTALIVPFQARKDMFAGKVLPQEPTGKIKQALERLPSELFARAVVLGVVSAVAFAPLPILGLAAAGVTEWLAAPFINFKILFSMVVASAVTPLISLHAMVVARGHQVASELTE
jgi:hypothetical protein